MMNETTLEDILINYRIEQKIKNSDMRHNKNKQTLKQVIDRVSQIRDLKHKSKLKFFEKEISSYSWDKEAGMKKVKYIDKDDRENKREAVVDEEGFPQFKVLLESMGYEIIEEVEVGNN